MDTQLWQRQLLEVCLRQLREEVAQAPIFQLGDGTLWCAIHNCSAYECRCALREEVYHGEERCDRCGNILAHGHELAYGSCFAHIERDEEELARHFEEVYHGEEPSDTHYHRCP